MDNLKHWDFFKQNCDITKNIKAWLWNLNRSIYNIRIIDNQYCFVRGFVVPLNCNSERKLIEIAKSIIKQLK